MTREDKIQKLLPNYLGGDSAENIIYNMAEGRYTPGYATNLLLNIKENVVDRKTGRTTRIVDLGVQSFFAVAVGSTLSIDDHFKTTTNNIPGQNLAYRIRNRLIAEHGLIEADDFEVDYKGYTASIKKLREI